MSKEIELATSLKREAKLHLSRPSVSIEGVKVSHPYYRISELLMYRRGNPNDFFNPDEIESWKTVNHLFQPENIPKLWAQFIKQAGELRRMANSEGPLDLVQVVHNLITEDPLAQELAIPDFKRLPSNNPDLRDENEIRSRVDIILSNKELREHFLTFAAYFAPDRTDETVGFKQVTGILRGLGIKEGTLLDLGCGSGAKTLIWQKETGLTTIGVDRQACQDRYQENWRIDIPQAAFLRADFTQSLPFPEESIDVAIMEYITYYVSIPGLTEALKEVGRVLKSNRGLLFVGPQTTGTLSEWRVFRKERAGQAETILLESKLTSLFF